MNNDFIASVDFLKSYEWRKVRQKALIKYGNSCMCCGAKPTDDVYLCVDHIKPRKTHPELALDIDNLQILCNVCNHGKGNWSDKDWRENEVVGDFVITKEWLRQHTKNGAGLTKARANVVGMSYPLSKGWFKRIVGMTITNEQRLKFENSGRDKKVKIEPKDALKNKSKELKRVEDKLAQIMKDLEKIISNT